MIAIEKVRQRAEADARTYGYFLHPDPTFLHDLLEGLKRNEERYGYPSCPCRTASGVFEYDRDIVCPCDYRDPDVAEFGSCYCALYVRRDLNEGKTPILPIPERRPKWKQERAYSATSATPTPSSTEAPASREIEPQTHKEGPVGKKLWYCGQCGYVVFREDPPYVCPICKAKREIFREMDIRTYVQNKDS